MNNELLNIDIINKYLTCRKIIWTKHCLNRINQRNISILSIKKAIKNGKVIEYYYNDYPFPSCLIRGKDEKNKIIHIVCGMSIECIYMITAYYPNKTKWNEDRRN